MTTRIQNAWQALGTGPDVEVVANLVYALILYDKERFRAGIKRGIDFLLNSHQGYRWTKHLVLRRHYGTYVALRALCAAGADRRLIEKVVQSIEHCREADGSWGIEGQGSSPLQTAIALLTLSIGYAGWGRASQIHDGAEWSGNL